MPATGATATSNALATSTAWRTSTTWLSFTTNGREAAMVAILNPFYAAPFHRPEPKATPCNGPLYAEHPRAPINASPVPHLTSLYHFNQAGEYGNRGYP